MLITLSACSGSNSPFPLLSGVILVFGRMTIAHTIRIRDTQRMNSWLPGRKDEGEGIVRGVGDGHAHTAISKMHNQQSPTV